MSDDQSDTPDVLTELQNQFDDLEAEADSVAIHRIDGDQDVVAVHNLTDEPRRPTVDVDEDLTPILDDGRSEIVSNDPCEIDLRGYGYYWFRASEMRL
jgi:hypothetical protein